MIATLTRRQVVRECLQDATKAQEVAAFCYERGQAMTENGALANFQRDAAYWSKRARVFLFQTIGDGSSEDDIFDDSLGVWS